MITKKSLVFSPFFQGKVVLASSDGLGFKIDTKQLIASTKSGKRILSLNKNAFAKSLSICEGDLLVVVG